MDMRLFTGLLIKLFLAFCFLFSASSFSEPITDADLNSTHLFSCGNFASGYVTLSTCNNAVIKSQIQLYAPSKPDLAYKDSHLQYVGVYNREHKYNLLVTFNYSFVNIQVVIFSKTQYTPPPQCNADEILNPETNTCEARCTAPDVWDPVTQQCITEKNRCDVLGERQPVVEVDWRQSSLGSSFVGHHACMPSGCVVTGTKDVGCLSDSDRCYGDAKYTGTQCTYTEGVTSGWCSDETCSDQKPTEPVPDPENPNPEPPSPNPDPTPGDGLTPPNPDTSPDPDNPNLDEEANKGVVNELNTANKTLENIQKTLEVTLDEITTQNKDVDRANDKLILGIQNLTKAVNDKPVGGGGGGGSGDGEGEGSSVSGASCDAFECKGDAVVCYIAKKQWEEACGVEKAKRDDVPLITKGIDKIITDHPLDDLNAGTLNVDSVMNKYTNGGGLNVSKACPAPDFVDAGIASFSLDYTPFCDLAKIIHFFIVAFALVGSALLIAKYGL